MRPSCPRAPHSWVRGVQALLLRKRTRTLHARLMSDLHVSGSGAGSYTTIYGLPLLGAQARGGGREAGGSRSSRVVVCVCAVNCRCHACSRPPRCIPRRSAGQGLVLCHPRRAGPPRRCRGVGGGGADAGVRADQAARIHDGVCDAAGADHQGAAADRRAQGGKPCAAAHGSPTPAERATRQPAHRGHQRAVPSAVARPAEPAAPERAADNGAACSDARVRPARSQHAHRCQPARHAAAGALAGCAHCCRCARLC